MDDAREATAREALGGHLLRALWRSGSPDMSRLATRSPGGVVAGRFAAGDGAQKRSSFLNLSIEQAFEQSAPDEAIVGFRVCQQNPKTKGMSSAKELAWFGATLAASKFTSPEAAAKRFLAAAPPRFGSSRIRLGGCQPTPA